MPPVGDNREGRASRKQSQKPWRTMGMGNYPRKEIQKGQELTLLSGQGSHRACPAGVHDHLGQGTVGCSPFISFTNDWVLFACFLLSSSCSAIAYWMWREKQNRELIFSSFKPLTRWRETGLMERVIFVIGYSDIGVWCGNWNRLLVVFFGEAEMLEGRCKLIYGEGEGRLWQTLMLPHQNSILFLGHISRLRFSDCLAIKSGHMTSSDQWDVSRNNSHSLY